MGNPPLWDQSTMGYSPHKQCSNISILHRKKWKSWAVILWLDLLVQSYLMNIQFLWFTSNPRKPSQWSLGESGLHRTNTTLKHFNNQFLIKCLRLCSPIPTKVVYSLPSFLLCPPLTLWMQVPSVILSPPHVGIRQLWSPNLTSVMASDMWPSHCEPFQWWVKQPKGSCLGRRSGTLVA